MQSLRTQGRTTILLVRGMWMSLLVRQFEKRQATNPYSIPSFISPLVRDRKGRDIAGRHVPRGAPSSLSDTLNLYGVGRQRYIQRNGYVYARRVKSAATVAGVRHSLMLLEPHIDHEHGHQLTFE